MEDMQQYKEIIEIIGIILGIILAIIEISGHIFKRISIITKALKWILNKIKSLFCIVGNWFRIIFTINKLDARANTLEGKFEDYKTDINSIIQNNITQLKSELKEQGEHFNKKIESLESKIKEGVDKVEENKKTRPVVELREPKKEEDFHDTRNGLIYKTTIINNKIWFAEDLNYFAERSKGYIDRPGNTYNWETAMASVLIGWHIPSQEEWLELIKFAGGKENAGKKLKAKEGWSVEWFANCNGTDDFGFAALPYSKASSRDNCGWWSSTERGSEAFVVIIENNDSIETRYEGKRNSVRKFVRCIKD